MTILNRPDRQIGERDAGPARSASAVSVRPLRGMSGLVSDASNSLRSSRAEGPVLSMNAPNRRSNNDTRHAGEAERTHRWSVSSTPGNRQHSRWEHRREEGTLQG
jgi:hypothetical protein